MKVHGIVNDSIVDGPGLRLAIFLQGCPRKCPGCHNPKSQPFDGGTQISVPEIIELYNGNPLLDGVTFSGGEPFSQVIELIPIANHVYTKGGTVWCYTGYTFEELLKMDLEADNDHISELLIRTDILVDGPFIQELRDLNLKFRGSSNQRIIDVQRSIDCGRVIEGGI
jgi:anaerobic ribonucleoside-triphosphate reductase activating protein